MRSTLATIGVKDGLRSALSNLAIHKLRTSLTMLGMIFGVGAVIAMLSIGAGAEQKALETIDRMGLRNVIVRARDLKPDEAQEIRKKSLGLSPRDAAAIQEATPGVEFVGPRIRVVPYRTFSAQGKSEVKLFGVTPRHAELSGLTLSSGRFVTDEDEATHAQVCVIGDAVARDLFGILSPLDQDLKVNDLWLRVVGVLTADLGGGEGLGGIQVGSTSREIYVPLSTALRKLDRDPLDSPLTEIVVRLTPKTSPDEAAAVISGLLDRLHGGAKDFEIVVPEALLAQSRKTQRLFNIVMGAIAGISLLVGGIGIMNIMLATVLERTREIGIRRAIGARRGDIRFQFVVESFTLSVLGGLAGMAMGILIARLVATYAGWETLVTVSSLVLSTGVSATVGLLSGLYPAHRAARLDPIEALRYE